MSRLTPYIWVPTLALVPVLVVFALPDQSAPAKKGEVNTATEIRLMDPGWWPTKGTPAREEYVGSSACARCHADVVSQKDTPMAHALEPASTEAFQDARQALRFHIGGYEYELAQTSSGAKYSATSGAQSASVPINWVFGNGQFGRTYMYEQNGSYYETRLSFYSAPKALDFTTGSPRFAPNRIEMALGRRMSPEEPPLCFGCHSTAATTSGRFDPSRLVPGITCEACHGPGAQHVAQMSLAHDEQTPSLIMNPARLGPVDSVDFCGACHRTSVDVSLSGVSGILTLRFPAYRLQRSRCWGDGAARLTCIACHNAHRPAVHDASFYDQKCISCHATSVTAKSGEDQHGKPCPVAKALCVSCHMPKYAIPEMHTSFTDHKIAIHQKGDQFTE